MRAIDGAVARLGDAAAGVAAVGSTSFWHSLMGIDAAGTPRPRSSIGQIRAPRGGNQASRGARPERHLAADRLSPPFIVLAGQAALAAADRPGHISPHDRWLSFAEYALGRLCRDDAGAVTICMASGTGLLDVHTMIWDAEMLDVSGIDADRLSPLVDLGPPGCLRRGLRQPLAGARGRPWFPALGDGACANVGSGAIGPSRIALTVGTSAAVRMILPRAPDQRWTVPDGLWAYRLDRDRAVLGGALSNGGNLLRWIWDTTGTDRDDETTAAAAALAPDLPG